MKGEQSQFLKVLPSSHGFSIGRFKNMLFMLLVCRNSTNIGRVVVDVCRNCTVIDNDIADVGRNGTVVVGTGRWGWGNMAALVAGIAALVVGIAALVAGIAALVVGIAAGFAADTAAGRRQEKVAADTAGVAVGRLLVGRPLVAADLHVCGSSSTQLLPPRR